MLILFSRHLFHIDLLLFLSLTVEKYERFAHYKLSYISPDIAVIRFQSRRLKKWILAKISCVCCFVAVVVFSQSCFHSVIAWHRFRSLFPFSASSCPFSACSLHLVLPRFQVKSNGRCANRTLAAVFLSLLLRALPCSTVACDFVGRSSSSSALCASLLFCVFFSFNLTRLQTDVFVISCVLFVRAFITTFHFHLEKHRATKQDLTDGSYFASITRCSSNLSQSLQHLVLFNSEAKQ